MNKCESELEEWPGVTIIDNRIENNIISLTIRKRAHLDCKSKQK